MKKIQRFFWWCAGANTHILEDCPTEHPKFFGIGGTILFTAMMASFAGGYAIYTAFQNEILAYCFGLFWGCMIFNLDRYIVSTIGKGDGTARISREELLNSSPRLLMAILLGFVIATPLEVKIFEKEIQVEIKKIINEQRDNLAEGQNDRLREIQRIKNRMAELRAEFDTLSGRYSGGDPRIASRQNAIRELGSEEKEIRDKMAGEQSDLEQARSEYNFADAQVNNLNLSDEQRQNYIHQKSRAQIKMARLRPIIQNYQNRLNTINQEKGESSRAISNVQGELEGEMSVVHQRNQNELQKLSEQLKQHQEARDADLQGYGAVAEQYNGFMARLEALDRLCWRTVATLEEPVAATTGNNSTNSSDSLATAKQPDTIATGEVKTSKERTPVYWARILITLMFIFIEVAPVLFKMMTESGPYDDRIDEVKYQSEVSKKKKFSDINEQVNMSLMLNTGLNKNRLDAELAANASLLKTIAEAQAAIAVEAIKTWKRQKMAEVSERPESVLSVSSNGHGSTLSTEPVHHSDTADPTPENNTPDEPLTASTVTEPEPSPETQPNYADQIPVNGNMIAWTTPADQDSLWNSSVGEEELPADILQPSTKLNGDHDEV